MTDANIINYGNEDTSFVFMPSPDQLQAIREEIRRRGWNQWDVTVSGEQLPDPSVPVLRFTVLRFANKESASE